MFFPFRLDLRTAGLATLCCSVLYFVIGARSVVADEADWPQFRGPNGQGVVASQLAPISWDETKGVRWKTTIPGRGWSSPVVAGNQVWLTTAVEESADPDTIEAVGGTRAEDLSLASRLELRAICIDRSSGKLIHNVLLETVDQPNPIHSLNSYASPTPVYEDGRLYCHFGRYGTQCLDTTTLEIPWEQTFQIEHFVGPGSSPALCDDLLVLTCDGADKQFIVAVDKMTGAVVWQKDRPPIRSKNPDFRKSYCTPLVVTETGSKQVVIPGAQWIVAYAPEDGRMLWSIDHGRGFSLVSRPVATESHLYFCTGYVGAGLLAVQRGGQGDITDTHIDWTYRKQVPNQSSPVVQDNRIYLVSDNGIAQCLNASSGERLWRKRLDGSYSASPLIVGNYLYFFNREGLTTIFDLARDAVEIAKNELAGRLMASPAVVDSELIMRTDSHLYAIAR